MSDQQGGRQGEVQGEGMDDRVRAAAVALESARDELESLSRRRATHARFIADAVLVGDEISSETLAEYAVLVTGDREARQQWRTAFDALSRVSNAYAPASATHQVAGRNRDFRRAPRAPAAHGVTPSGEAPRPTEAAPFDPALRPRVTVRLPHAVGTADQARLSMARHLRAARLLPHVVIDAEIILGELVHNAIEHGRPLAGGDIEIAWCLDGEMLRISVTDGGRVGDLQASGLGDARRRGRGLTIVDRLSESWDCDNEHGTRLNAYLAVDAPAARDAE